MAQNRPGLGQPAALPVHFVHARAGKRNAQAQTSNQRRETQELVRIDESLCRKMKPRIDWMPRKSAKEQRCANTAGDEEKITKTSGATFILVEA